MNTARRVSKMAVFRDPVHFFAFGFGAGLSPVAPGTAGTLVGLLIHSSYGPFGLELGPRIIVFVVTACAGVWLCGLSAQKLGVHDHPGIVWDEISGFLLAALFIPDGWQWFLLAFLLFRFFDIVKPWPIAAVDTRIEGGFGIMLDDLLAGFFTGCLLLLLRLVLG